MDKKLKPRIIKDRLIPQGVDKIKTSYQLHKALDIPHIEDLVATGPVMAENLPIVQDWWKRVIGNGEYRNLILLSDETKTTTGRGVGKTHIASSAFYALGRFDQYIPNHLSWHVRGLFYSDPRLFIEEMREYRTALRLVGPRQPSMRVVWLDDFTPEIAGNIQFASASTQADELLSMIWSLINHLLSEEIILLMTANMTKENFIKWVGASSYSRLRPYTTIVDLTGASDYRPVIQRSQNRMILK